MRSLEWKETPSRRQCCMHAQNPDCIKEIPKKTKFLREVVYQPKTAGLFSSSIYNYCPVCAEKYLTQILEHVNNIMDEIDLMKEEART